MNIPINECPRPMARITKVRRLLLIIVLVIGGLACVIASIAWSGCASDAGSRSASIPEYPLTGIGSRPIVSNKPFGENIEFLKKPPVPVSEVYATLGHPDWESKPLRLFAYRTPNNQALFVTYGTDNIGFIREVPAWSYED